MSAHMKKHPTDKNTSSQILYIIDDDVTYAIPKKVAQPYIIKFKKAVHHEGNISSKDLFAEYDNKNGKAAALLKGLRAREDLSQIEFAKKIDVSQSNLSKMENGSRPIGRIVAKRIAKVFSVNYRHFLE